MHLFCFRCFQNFDVDFWPLLYLAEKVDPLKQFWQIKFFSLQFYFLSSIWIYKLSASRITENSSHCYPLTLNLFALLFCIHRLDYSWLLFYIASHIVIALPTIARARVVALLHSFTFTHFASKSMREWLIWLLWHLEEQ